MKSEDEILIELIDGYFSTKDIIKESHYKTLKEIAHMRYKKQVVQNTKKVKKKK